MCSALTLDCGYDNSTIILIGDVYCPNTKCLGNFCLHKKTFQSLGRSDYHVRNVGLCARSAFFFEDQMNSFSLSVGPGVCIFEENPKSIQDVIGNVYCPGKYCSNRENCGSLDGFVTTPRSIYCCGNCGAWLFVHKVAFTLEEHLKTTKTVKTCFFFARKNQLCTQQTTIT